MMTAKERIKDWIANSLASPERARTTLSNLAVGAGLAGLALTLLAVIKAQG